MYLLISLLSKRDSPMKSFFYCLNLSRTGIKDYICIILYEYLAFSHMLGDYVKNVIQLLLKPKNNFFLTL
jgi:hypothetical protein